MVLSAADIHNKKFSTKMRGYNIDEVNDFLNQIIKDYQILKEENDQLTAKLKQSSDALSYYDDLKGSLNQSILVAQEAADNVKQTADHQAQQTIAAAQNKADELLSAATQQANQVLAESSKKAAAVVVATNDYRDSIKTFRTKMIAMLQTQLEFANRSDWTELLEGSDYHQFQEINDAVKQLDSLRSNSVESESNQSLPKRKQRSEYAEPTVLIFPNGEVRPI
ncbi:Cell division initiation protein DivIVA [Fructilactobacillus florum 8D]|uniref:Cell division initiation protein DivIVA n=1 Tax=Fructilactobacillus florum 8D TaxID=1221538 RepID=W9EJW7_9LACO|nr:DivIVA domain-containing protein [Fructilactobacillus florum]EKK20313.1 Cell division initiation protein DivIVA [Fructilactobacillus florum 2F]ETO39974.1 Cell division initiation protein DivIVA [Fructilactobacillus florum 8D]